MLTHLLMFNPTNKHQVLVISRACSGCWGNIKRWVKYGPTLKEFIAWEQQKDLENKWNTPWQIPHNKKYVQSVKGKKRNKQLTLPWIRMLGRWANNLRLTSAKEFHRWGERTVQAENLARAKVSQHSATPGMLPSILHAVAHLTHSTNQWCSYY